MSRSDFVSADSAGQTESNAGGLHRHAVALASSEAISRVLFYQHCYPRSQS